MLMKIPWLSMTGIDCTGVKKVSHYICCGLYKVIKRIFGCQLYLLLQRQQFLLRVWGESAMWSMIQISVKWALMNGAKRDPWGSMFPRDLMGLQGSFMTLHHKLSVLVLLPRWGNWIMWVHISFFLLVHWLLVLQGGKVKGKSTARTYKSYDTVPKKLRTLDIFAGCGGLKL